MKHQAERTLDQVWVNWREQRIVRELLTGCRVAGGSVLDVPCGYGRFASLFAPLGVRAIGVDVDPGLVHLALESQIPDRMEGGVCGSIFELPFADNSFDGVQCVRFLHLQYSDQERLRILRELSRVSRRFVLISVYRFTPLHGLARRWNGTRGRLRMMTDRQLVDLAQASGLERQSMHCLLRYCHMQTFVLLTKSV